MRIVPQMWDQTLVETDNASLPQLLLLQQEQLPMLQTKREMTKDRKRVRLAAEATWGQANTLDRKVDAAP